MSLFSLRFFHLVRVCSQRRVPTVVQRLVWIYSGLLATSAMLWSGETLASYYTCARTAVVLRVHWARVARVWRAYCECIARVPRTYRWCIECVSRAYSARTETPTRSRPVTRVYRLGYCKGCMIVGDQTKRQS